MDAQQWRIVTDILVSGLFRDIYIWSDEVLRMMLTEEEIRQHIRELEKEVQPFVDGNYDHIVKMMRCRIKGLKEALGEEYSIAEGK